MKVFFTRQQKCEDYVSVVNMGFAVRLVFSVNHERTQQPLMIEDADLTQLKAFDILFSIDSALKQPAIIPGDLKISLYQLQKLVRMWAPQHKMSNLLDATAIAAQNYPHFSIKNDISGGTRNYNKKGNIT